MVGLVIVSHSKTLAQGVLELARQMGGEGLSIQLAAGLDQPDNPLGTDANLILQAIQAAYSEDGVLVLMDLGSAVLSAEMALELLPDEQRGLVWLCEAPLVEGAVAAAVQARLGSPLEQVRAEAVNAWEAKRRQILPVDSAPPEAPPGAPDSGAEEQLELILTVRNRLGLHARPAARFVQCAAAYPQARVTVQNLTRHSVPVHAVSINALAALGVRQGHCLRLIASGGTARAALAAMQQLAEQDFGEAELDLVSEAQIAPSVPIAVAAGQPLQGLAVSPGIALAPARWLHQPSIAIPDHPATDPAAEWQALQRALEQTRREVEATQAAARQRLEPYAAAIFDAHLLFLQDPALLEPARAAIFTRRLNAAAAWQAAVEQVAASYRQLDDAYLQARLADLENVARQALSQLTGQAQAAPTLHSPGILLADELSAAQTALLDPALAVGFCTARGGPNSHSAILARGLGIPAVAGLGAALLQIAEDTPLLLDGESGRLWLTPDESLTAEYTARMREQHRRTVTTRAASTEPAHTRDGRRIEVAANIAIPADARLAVACGADSVGLFRSEFLFLNRPAAPTEDEQYAAYRQAAEWLRERTLTIRTLDAGGDKPLPYLGLQAETNPYLGWRAIRICLERPEFFQQQLRAILRLAVEFPVRVMFPLVSILEEWRAARRLLEEARQELAQRGLAAPARIETGMMVETPAAALCIEPFAAEVDFFSIGSNDLTQYTLAAERGNPRLAQLADPLQPAVLALIQRVIQAAHQHGKPVAVCGEMAADPPAAALLVGLGVDELSVNPPAIPLVKQLIRGLDCAPLHESAQAVLALESPAAVRQLFQAYTGR